jgi:hypothetical protein
MFSPHINNISNTASLTSPSADSAALFHTPSQGENWEATTEVSHCIPYSKCTPTGIRQGRTGTALKGTDMDFNGRFICVQKESLLGNIGATNNGKARNVDMSTHWPE